MSKINLRIFVLPLLIAIISSAAFSQATGGQPAQDPYSVTNTGFKSRVFEIHNRTPDDLIPVLNLLTSGFKGAQISGSDTFRTITVRDFPENIAAIDEAIKRLDTPETARPDIEIRMEVLVASNLDTATNLYPADLKDVIKELQTTLTYKNYGLLASVVQRTRDSRGSRSGYLQGQGTAEVTFQSPASPSGVEKRIVTYSFSANSVALASASSGPSSTQLGNFNFSLVDWVGRESRIHSDLNIKEGEKVVVGTAGLVDKALILVMTVKVLR